MLHVAGMIGIVAICSNRFYHHHALQHCRVVAFGIHSQEEVRFGQAGWPECACAQIFLTPENYLHFYHTKLYSKCFLHIMLRLQFSTNATCIFVCEKQHNVRGTHTHTHTIHNCFSSSNIGHNNQQHTIATPNKYAAWPEHEWFITLRERIFKWHHLCWLCGIFGNASQYQEDRSDWCECICWILALGAIFISIAIRCTVVYDSRQWTAKNYMYI